jgi:predicted Rossmann fold flavoprotein
MDKFDVVIIGGGACGLMCAVQAGYVGKSALVIEHIDKVGAKILISGGGRCNYTNMHTTAANFISQNEHFCKSALSQWSVEDTIQFFEMFGIEGQEKTLGQLFPSSNKASDIVKAFENLIAELGQQIYTNTSVQNIEKVGDAFVLKISKNGKSKEIHCPNLVIATGGLPIPKMGASDFAFKVAEQFDLKITKTAPALVPLVIGHKDREWFEAMSGTSVYSVVSNDEISFEENILFTHWGLSGPVILQISSYWRAPKPIYIDFLPHQSIKKLIEETRQQNGKKLLQNFLSVFLPNKLCNAMAVYLPYDKNLASLSNAELELIENTIHHFEVIPAGDKGYEKAEVMRGGIDTNELSSKSLEAKNVPGLFFGGECIDVTGWLGGYNFQWAWASGYVIAQNLH